MKLSGNTILITGGTSGLGLGLANRLLELGNTVIVTSRHQETINEIIKGRENMFGYSADVSNLDSVKNLKDNILKYHSNLNMVINSAGIMKPVNFFVDDSLITNEIQSNLIGTINVDKVFLPVIVKSKESMLINISSGLAYVASTAHPIYSASKSGVNALTEAIKGQADYLGYKNLHIVQVAPPLVSETNLEPSMHENGESNPMNMKLDDFVSVVIKGIRKNKLEINPGPSKVLRLLGKIGTTKLKIKVMRRTMDTVFKSK